jgi:hypothetical protein
MGKCYSLPGLKKVGYVPVSMLPSDIVFIALAGGTVPLYDSVTYFDVAPGAVCEVEEEYGNGVQVEQAKLKFSTLAAIPTNEPLAFVFVTMNDELLLIGAREKPHATIKVNTTTGQTDGDASIKSYTVTFKARKALVRYEEFYNAL